MLRMILDCTTEQIKAIQAFLEELHGSGEICYGMHVADTSLMTCFVDGLNDGEHIHFVDGGDGGYAMAAKKLIKEMKKLHLVRRNSKYNSRRSRS